MGLTDMVSRKKYNYRKIFAGFVVLCILVVVFSFISRHFVFNFQTAMLVNGEPVTVREFEQQMEYGYRAFTLNHFVQTHNIEVDKDFWDKELGGITPREFLMENTAKACALIKIQELKMKEKGILSDISYSSFLKDFERENKRRREIVSQGGVIYGPQQYSENDYFEYVFSNLQVDLKDQMAKEYGWYEKSNLKDYYEENKDTYYRYSENIDILKLVIPYSMGTKEEIYNQLIAVSEMATDRESFEMMAGQIGEVEDQRFTEETARTDSRYFEALKLAAMELEENSVSGVIDDGENLAVIYCISKEETGYIPFDDVIDNVGKLYVDECYEKWLNDEFAKAEIILKKAEKVLMKVE